MRIAALLVLISVPFIQGCPGDEACPSKTFISVANVQNMTGRDLSLNLCTNSAKQSNTVQIPADQSGKMTIEKHNGLWIKTGGGDTACDPEEFKSATYLAKSSFDQVTLCHESDDATRIAFVETNQSCPDGYVAQTTPVADTCAILPTSSNSSSQQ